MKKTISYNGQPKKTKFHKLKKHLTILKNRASFKHQVNKIRKTNSPILNQVLEAILMVKNSKYDKQDLHTFTTLNAYRNFLQNNNTVISYEIFNSSATRQVKDIYRISASPKAWSQFLYCLTKKLNSTKILEIGTNLGVSGAYLLSAVKQNSDTSKLITMEGVPQLCELAENQFSTITSAKMFKIISGLYDTTFPRLIHEESDFDLLFIDGNHQREPTIDYFNHLKNNIVKKAVFIFDDIHYSTEMTEAWNIIKNDLSVNYSVDLYKLGIIIIDDSDTNRNISFSMHLSYT